MTVFTGNKLGRYVIIGLQRGDLLLESIQKALEETGIRDAIVTSGVAATSHMGWHHIGWTDAQPNDMMLETDGPMEVSGIGGLVLDGVPHLHCTFADHNRAWAGHLEAGCRIAYVGEITMIELLDVDVERVANMYGVKDIRPVQKPMSFSLRDSLKMCDIHTSFFVTIYVQQDGLRCQCHFLVCL